VDEKEKAVDNLIKSFCRGLRAKRKAQSPRRKTKTRCAQSARRKAKTRCAQSAKRKAQSENTIHAVRKAQSARRKAKTRFTLCAKRHAPCASSPWPPEVKDIAFFKPVCYDEIWKI
jgi:hypothetical protein